MPYIDWEGLHRGRCTGQEVFRSQQSKAVGLKLSFDAEEIFSSETGEWTKFDTGVCHTSGLFWVIGKDGAVKAEMAERLASVLGWNGSFENPSITNDRCRFKVQPDKSESDAASSGKPVYYNACFIDPYERESSSSSGPDAAAAAAIDQQYGSQLRAICGGVEGPSAPPPSPAVGDGDPGPTPPEDIDVDVEELPF